MKLEETQQELLTDGRFLSALRVGIAVLGVLFLAIIISRMLYPFDNGILEAYNWVPAKNLIEGRNPYASAFSPPYSMTPYGIVFYALIGVGVKLFGFQFWWGRMLSVAGFVICLAAVFSIVRKLTRSRHAAWAALLAGMAMFPAQFWIASMRSDLIAAAFAFLALRLAFTIERDEKIKLPRLVGIILLAGAAFFTKQTVLLPVMFIFLRFVQLAEWRAAFFFGASFTALAASGIWLLNYTSGGAYLWQHFTHAQRLPHSWADSAGFLISLLTLSVFFFVLLFLAIYIYSQGKSLFARRGDRLKTLLRSPETLFLLYFFLSLGWAFVSAGRIGANVNYYLENSLVAAVVCGFIFEDFRRRTVLLPAWAMIVLLTLGGAYQMSRVLRGEYFRWEALNYYREVSDAAAPLIKPGSVCVSNNAELAMRLGCELHYDDFMEYSIGWSPELHEIFNREVRSGRYAAIFWGEGFDKIFPNYRRVPMSNKLPARYYPVYLYVPVDEQAP